MSGTDAYFDFVRLSAPLLVGEYNPYQNDAAEGARYALYPEPVQSAGGRMCRLVLNMEPRDYLRLFERTNLCHGRWSMPTARVVAAELRRERRDDRCPGSVIVCCGAKVAEAFGLPKEPFNIYSAGAPPTVVVLPHPSGLSRAWDAPGAFERARQLLRRAGVPLP